MVKLAKKFFTMSVVALTILWSVGIAALVPTMVVAVDCPSLEAGDLFKVAGNTAVYLVNSDMKRMYFFNAEVYKSWYTDYSAVQTIGGVCVDNYPSGGAVSYRPGAKLVKVTISPSVYAVLANSQLLKITDEASAAALYGATWSKVVRDLPDLYFGTYTVAAGTLSDTPHNGMLVKKEGSSDVYYVVGGKLYKVEGSLSTAATGDVRTVSAATFGKLEVAATTVTGASVTATVYQATGTGTTPTVPGVTGSVTVSLAADTPASESGLPIGSSNINVLKFNVKNTGSADMTIDEITLKRGGTGKVTGLTAYVYNGEARVGTGKTFASDTNEATFSVLNTVVKAGQTLPLTIRLSLSASALTGNHVFSVNALKLASGTVAGLPVTGNLMSVNSGVTAGSVTVANNGTLTAPVLGDLAATVAQFKLTAGTEDIDVNSFTLKQDGTITTSFLSNFVVYQGATKLAATVTTNGRLVTFVLASPLRILNGANKILNIKADVSGEADAGDTIDFSLEYTSDVKAIGASYGFGVLVTDSYAAASQSLTLLGGGVTISNKSAAAHDIKVDSTEVELGRVAILAKADTVEIQRMTVNIATTLVASTTANSGIWGLYHDVNSDSTMDAADTILLRNLKLKDLDTGRTVGSAQAITDCATITADAGAVDIALTCTYTDYFNVAKGATRNIALVADINSAAISGIKYLATFDFSGTTKFIIKDSKDVAVTDIVPATTIASNLVTTRSSSLIISRSTTPESRTVVKNSTVDALGMIFAAGSGTGNDVKVTGLNLDTWVDADVSTNAKDGTFTESVENTVNANELVTYVSLYVGETLIAGPVSVGTDGHVNFTSSKFVGGYYTIPAGTSKTIVARATVSGNAPYGTLDDAFSFTLQSADVTYEDAAGTTYYPTVTGTDLNHTTTPLVAISITGGGTITTAADNSKPLTQLLTAGLATEQEVHRIKLTATKETFIVDKMTVGISSADTTYDNVQYLRLYDTAGVALSGAIELSATGSSTFTGLNISVPVAGTTVVVKAMLSAIGERDSATVATAGIGSDTGDALTFALSTVTDDFHAQGGSGQVDTGADAAPSNAYKVVKSIPLFVVGTLPNTNLAVANVVIFKFTVTAGANEDISLARVTPYITFSDSDGQGELVMTTGTLGVYDMDAASTALNTLVGTNVQTSTTGAFGISFATSTALPVIGKGTTKTFEIRANFTGVEASDSVTVNFAQDSAALSSVVETGNTAIIDDNAKFIWSDNGADTDGTASTEWLNSFLIPKWDTKSLSVSKS